MGATQRQAAGRKVGAGRRCKVDKNWNTGTKLSFVRNPKGENERRPRRGHPQTRGRTSSRRGVHLTVRRSTGQALTQIMWGTLPSLQDARSTDRKRSASWEIGGKPTLGFSSATLAPGGRWAQPSSSSRGRHSVQGVLPVPAIRKAYPKGHLFRLLVTYPTRQADLGDPAVDKGTTELDGRGPVGSGNLTPLTLPRTTLSGCARGHVGPLTRRSCLQRTEPPHQLPISFSTVTVTALPSVADNRHRAQRSAAHILLLGF